MANENLKTSLNRTYSYDDFVSEANRLGLLGQFSDADLKLAQQNPDAGMSILGYKNDYRNATTDEARALANQGANSVRSSWGGYTGGGDGGSFKLNPLSPGSFSYQDAPTYTSQYAGDIASLWQQQRDYSPFSYSRQNDLAAALDKVVNRKEFSYDAETDPLYAQYRKQYTREGKRATADALGQAAAASGGRVSSWAQTAANQAANYYAGQMTDKIPELYKLAYQKYLTDFQMDESGLQALQSDRSAEQGEWQGNLNALTGKLNTAQALEQADYSKFLNELNQYNTDRSFAYNQLLDEVGQQTQLRQETTQQRQQERDNAMQLYQLMGYAPEDAAKILGIESGTPTLAGRERDDAQKQQEWSNQYNIANLGGSYGDFNGLNALGITPDAQNLLKLALANAGRTSPVGSGTTGAGGGGGGGYSPTGTPDATAEDVDDKAAAALERADAANGQVQTMEDWEALAAKYGEQNLLANGYKKPGSEESAGKPQGGTSSIDTVGYNESDGSFTWFGKRYKNAQALERDLNAYISRGVVTPKIEAAIKEQLSQLGFNAG